MPPKAAATGPKTVDPNERMNPEERKMKMLYHVIVSQSENGGKVDYKKLAAVMGLKNGGVASVTWGQLRRELAKKYGTEIMPATVGASPAKAATKPKVTDSAEKKVAGKKRKAEDDESPTKKGRGAKNARTVKKEEVDEADETDEDTTVIKKELTEAANADADDYDTINVKTSDEP